MNANRVDYLIRVVILSNQPPEQKTKQIELLLIAYKEWCERQPV